MVQIGADKRRCRVLRAHRCRNLRPGKNDRPRPPGRRGKPPLQSQQRQQHRGHRLQNRAVQRSMRTRGVPVSCFRRGSRPAKGTKRSQPPIARRIEVLRFTHRPSALAEWARPKPPASAPSTLQLSELIVDSLCITISLAFRGKATFVKPFARPVLPSFPSDGSVLIGSGEVGGTESYTAPFERREELSILYINTILGYHHQLAYEIEQLSRKFGGRNSNIEFEPIIKNHTNTHDVFSACARFSN